MANDRNKPTEQPKTAEPVQQDQTTMAEVLKELREMRQEIKAMRNPQLSHLQQQEEYLLSKGWTKAGGTSRRGEIMWQDPVGSNGPSRERTVGTLKKVGGGDEVLKQHFIDPTPWQLPTSEAITTQRARDEAAARPEPVAAVA